MANRILRNENEKPCQSGHTDSPGSPPDTSSEYDRITKSVSGSEYDRQTNVSCLSESDSESDYVESKDKDLYCDSDDITGCPNTVSPVLMNDIRLLKETYPESNCSYRCLDSDNEMEMDISFPTTILEKTTAEAWGLIYGEPVVIRLSLNQRSYLNVEGVEKIEVAQKGCTTGVLMQLKRIVEEFCNIQFRNLSNEKVQAALESLPFDNSMRNSGESEATTVQSNSLRPQDAKEIPSLSRGFLVQLYDYIERRFLTLNSFCPVCDKHHIDAVCWMLKPVVCSNAECIFQYHALGIMADAVVTEPQVIHLLICLTKVAVKSYRNKIIFDPYPTILDPSDDRNFAIHPEKKDFTLLGGILDRLPPMQELMMNDTTELKKILNQEHELCYPLLKCGSPIENWHSILRNGLVVATNTNRQLHGNVYGKGIYMSPYLATAVHYTGTNIVTRPTEYQKRESQQSSELDFMDGNPHEFVCLTLCEVIDCDKLKKPSVAIWTCDDSDFVCTRFFFIYNKHARCLQSSVYTLTPKIWREIEKALAAKG